MFELLEDTKVLPVPEDVIVQVHSGMNKVRVSVGNYVSEPSNVYIITSQDEALLRSFIVFYVVEPGTHVIYGYAGNPYDPVFREEVLQEAVDFVEEMGAILEEIPWEGMSPEERGTWISNESIYPLDEINGMEEIVDLEEIEPEALQEVVEEKEGAEEGAEQQPETPEPETPDEGVKSAVDPGKPHDEVEKEMEAQEDEVEENVDFDNLLKQAFLKPDLVKKSKMRKAEVSVEELPEDEEPADDEEALETAGKAVEADGEALEVEGKAAEIEEESEGEQFPPSPGTDEEEYDLVASEEDLAAAVDEDDLSALIQEVSEETYTETADDTPPGGQGQVAEDPGDQTRLTVIRYLSRF
jgi:hypothetical protein